MASIFTKIINNEIPCYKIAEDDNFFAFLDISPLTKGHTLVIPKTEVNYIFDLDDTNYSGLMSFAKKVAQGMKEAIDCKRIGVAVMGMEVPHAHIHLIPISKEGDMIISNPKLKLNNEEMTDIATKISSKVIL